MTDSTAHSDSATTDADAPGYADALRELDGILRELEGSDVDVDRLAARVARASELITVCRDKITTAELQIRQVTTDLDAAAEVAPGIQFASDSE
jgi:exodeoxyribonuclease VII small subunit